MEKMGKLRQSELLSLFICVPLARFLPLLVQRRTRSWHEPANLLRLCNTESFCHMDKTCLRVLVIFMLWYGVSQARYPQKQVQTSQGNPDLRIKRVFFFFFFCSHSQTQQIWLPHVLTGHSCPEISHYFSTRAVIRLQ